MSTLYRTATGEPLTVTNLTRIKYGYNAITPETGQAFFYSDGLWSTTRPVKTRFKVLARCDADAPDVLDWWEIYEYEFEKTLDVTSEDDAIQFVSERQIEADQIFAEWYQERTGRPISTIQETFDGGPVYDLYRSDDYGVTWYEIIP